MARSVALALALLLLGSPRVALAQDATPPPAPAPAPAPAPEPELGPPPAPPPGAHVVLEADEAKPPPAKPPAPPPGADSTVSVPKLILAEEPPDEGVSEKDARKKGRWYGWKLIIADAGTLTLALSEVPFPYVGETAYVVAGPAIHLGHKQPLIALLSFALRLGVPLTLNAVIPPKDCGSGRCFPPGWYLGALAVSAFDDALLAREWSGVSEKKAEDERRGRAQVALSPAVAATRKGAFVSVDGTF